MRRQQRSENQLHQHRSVNRRLVIGRHLRGYGRLVNERCDERLDERLASGGQFICDPGVRF